MGSQTAAQVPEELRTSVQYDARTRELSVARSWRAYGTSTQVFERIGANALLPAMGDAITPSNTMTPVQRRLRAVGFDIATEPAEDTTHIVTVTYSSAGQRLEDNRPEVRLSVGTETFERTHDWNGKPIRTESEDPITIEIPRIECSWSGVYDRFAEIMALSWSAAGKTNADDWLGLGPGTWIFKSVQGNTRLGDGRWRATFQFVALPPVTIGMQNKDGDEVRLDRRARYEYEIKRDAKGQIDTTKVAREPFEIGPDKPQTAGANDIFRAYVAREEVEFSSLFPDDDIDAEVADALDS